MKLSIKAYKATFPNLFIDAYTRHLWDDPKQYDIIYGKNQKEAVRDFCLNDDGYTYWELKSNINTRRFPKEDLYSQETSELLKPLPKEQIHHLTHSLGVGIGDYCPEEFYRNYSVYRNKHERCERLVELGLMSNHQKFGDEVYMVTKKGKEAVKTLLLVKLKETPTPNKHPAF